MSASTSAASSSLRIPAWAPLLGQLLATTIASAAFVYVVSSVGVSRLFDTVARAGWGFLAIVALEAVALAFDTFAAKTLSRTSWPTAIRGATAAHVACQLLPGGRVSGELARVHQARHDVGIGRAAHASLFLQATHVASTVAALALALAVLEEPPAFLALASGVLAWNAGLACVLFAAPRSASALATIARRLGADVLVLHRVEGRARASILGVLARSAHVAQAALAVSLLIGRFDLEGGAAAETLQILAGSAGDAVPGQIGVLEATFDAFAATIDASDLHAAVGVALLLRTARLVLLAPLGLAWWMARKR